MIFLVLSGKMIFLFPENMILFFRRKMKDGFSQKNTWEYDIFFKMLRKDGISKKIPLKNFVSGKYDVFSLDGK